MTVTVNVPQILHMVKTWAAHWQHMWLEGESFAKNYPKIPNRFCRVTFDTEKLNGKYREGFAPLSFVPDKKEISFIWIQFQFYSSTSMTGQRTTLTVNYSVLWGIASPEIMLLSGVV